MLQTIPTKPLSRSKGYTFEAGTDTSANLTMQAHLQSSQRQAVEAELRPYISYLASSLHVSYKEVEELVLRGLPQPESEPELESREVKPVSAQALVQEKKHKHKHVRPQTQSPAQPIAISRLVELVELGQKQTELSRHNIEEKRAALNWETRRVLQELAYCRIRPLQSELATFMPVQISRLYTSGYLVFRSLPPLPDLGNLGRGNKLHQTLSPQLPMLVRVVLPNCQQTPGDEYVLNRPVQVLIQKVERDRDFVNTAPLLPQAKARVEAREADVVGTRLYGLRIKVSRTDREFVKALFKKTVPASLLAGKAVYCVERVPGVRAVVSICAESNNHKRNPTSDHRHSQHQAKTRQPKPSYSFHLSRLLESHIEQLESLLGTEKLEIEYF